LCLVKSFGKHAHKHKNRMRFASQWIKLIIMCVFTVNYPVLVNGILMERIILTRGIRQGDLIRPYLFIICAEVLSSLLSKADREGQLEGVPTSVRGPCLNHLFFFFLANDSLLFCRADIEHWNRLANLLNKYESASGQRLNISTAVILLQNCKKKY
jgi:hypothetical protein